MKTQTVSLLLGSALSLCACVTEARNPEDPYEGFNRKMYGFNDGLDKAVFEPVAKGYRAITNPPIRSGVSNFVNNLREPVTFANQIFQGKIPDAANTVSRFVINTTTGIVGIIDTASAFGILRTDVDFGQTLGAWGVKPGPYLVLPFLGSTNVRDLVGTGIDIGLNPLSYAQFDGDSALRISNGVLGGLSARESVIDNVDMVRGTQLDTYTTLRRFYVRRRIHAIGAPITRPADLENVPERELCF